MGAAQMLGDFSDLEEGQRQQLFGVVYRNVESVRGVLDNLAELARLGASDSRQQRHVTLQAAVFESTRQLRDAARLNDVEIRIGELPSIEVNAAAVELCLVNLLSNGIKYADSNKPRRWVEVRAEIQTAETPAERRVVVQVRDNGIGVPPADRERLFQRFFRAHSGSRPNIDGTGLGLSIVRETVEALGGTAWAEFPDVGSSFSFSVPCRRSEDA
jgi:signal transduction histidine kinase